MRVLEIQLQYMGISTDKQRETSVASSESPNDTRIKSTMIKGKERMSILADIIIVSGHRGLSQDVILVHTPPSVLRGECSAFVVDELSGSFLTESEPVNDLWESTSAAGAPKVMGCIRDCRRRFRITEIPSRDC